MDVQRMYFRDRSRDEYAMVLGVSSDRLQLVIIACDASTIWLSYLQVQVGNGFVEGAIREGTRAASQMKTEPQFGSRSDPRL